MPSEQLVRILRSKTPASNDEIAALSDCEAWALVYANAPRKKDTSHQICFTGFNKAEREELRALADRSGWLKSTTTVTTTLSYLCTGETAGPAKVAKATASGVEILSREQFHQLLSHGELPTPS
jgi:NAD-dependent DNA ligase